MDIIELTRELGKALQNDDRFIAYNLAKQANDNDEELQNLINSFTDMQKKLSEELRKEDSDSENLKEIDRTIKSTYNKIMSNKNMIVFTAAQKSLESLVQNMTQIINLCANGEDPDTCQPSSGCSGSCSTCGGCS